MCAPTEHCTRHDVDERQRIQPALADDSNDFSEHLQRRRAHHIAKQLEEVCVSWIGTDCKSSLSEAVEDRSATLDIGRGASGNDEQLARLGGVRIPEHRRSDVTLPVPGMLARHSRRGRGTNCAHR